MSIAETVPSPRTAERHPPGLAVLFAAEMWERFSFYTVGAMLTLYLQDEQGFHWTKAQATALNANYLAFVYASPLIGGLIADRMLGFRRSVMIGALFFIAGHSLLSIHSLTAVYAALACLVVGNGFFKPNVSAMVGALYPEGSPLRDRAYNLFYMGINVGALAAPIVAHFMKQAFGFHPAFLVGAAGMIVSLGVLHFFRRHIAGAERRPGEVIPVKASHPTVSDRQRVTALIIVFAIIIVFWMVFHQNSSTLTYFAEWNTDWQLSGIISNAINPFFVIVLTFPLIGVWNWLRKRGLEPSTPAKMALGMLLTAASFYIMYFAGIAGGDTGRVSPWWLISSYAVVTFGELMLSPMGLSLVSKVAPMRMRGLMMGGWFVATAIGNKLTAIGVYWDEWRHSTFFAVLATCALVMGVVLIFLLKPLKRWMPEA